MRLPRNMLNNTFQINAKSERNEKLYVRELESLTIDRLKGKERG